MNDLPEEVRKSLNKAKYGWTKWGGPNYGLVQKNLTEFWYCQACKEEQTMDLPPYMFEFPEREYIRICSKCHHLRLENNIKPCQYRQLLNLVRSSHG